MTNSKTGYTIIEILVVLSITGIIFSSGFVSFREFSRRQLLAGNVRTLKGNLRQTQEYALIGKKPTGSVCDTSTLVGYDFYVISSVLYEIRAICSGMVVVKAIDLPSDITISAPAPNPVTFKSLGEGTNLFSDATIILTQISTGKTASVIVTKGGEIK